MTAKAVRVWVTRARPGAEETAARLAAMGLDAHVAPLLQVEPLDGAVDLEGVAALAFTSRNGVDAFVARHGVVNLPIFAVGDATADYARGLGFTAITSADGDVAALADVIRAARPAGVVLHAGPETLADDLVARLAAAEVGGRFAPVYRTTEPDALDPSTEFALTAGDLAAVLIHSPRAAAALARLVPPDRTAPLTLVALSPAGLAPLASHPFAARIAADRPREDALLSALAAALGISPARR